VLRHKVIFFRKQNLDEKQQVAFAKRFGEVTLAHPRCLRCRTTPKSSISTTAVPKGAPTTGTPT